jgi:hypothetical protein
MRNPDARSAFLMTRGCGFGWLSFGLLADADFVGSGLDGSRMRLWLVQVWMAR